MITPLRRSRSTLQPRPPIQRLTPTDNLAWQLSGQGISKGLTFVFYILLPLLIGIEEYGHFSFALAVSLIVVQPVVEMGLDKVVTKWVARGTWEVLNKALRIRATAAVVAFPLALTTSLLLRIRPTLLLLLFLYFVFTSFQNLAFAFFRGIEDMRPESSILTLERAAAIGFLLLLSFAGIADALLGPGALLCSTLLGIFFLLVMSRQPLTRAIADGEQGNGPRSLQLVKEGLVLGGVTFLWLIYFRIDSVILGVMRGDSEVGIYNVAYRIMEGIIFIPSIIMIVFFPQLAKRERFKEVFGRLLVLLAAVGLVTSTTLYFLSARLITLIYGPAFVGSIAILQTLSLVLLPMFIGQLTTQALIALDLNRKYLLVALLGTLLNISLNSLLIPRLGAIGAAWATLATETLVTLLSAYFVWRCEPAALRISSSALAIKEMLFTSVRHTPP